MKIGFIAPALDLDQEKKGERIFLLPPLTFPVLAALTPEDFEIEIIEERLRPIRYDSDFDLVGLTFVTAFAPRAYSIADKFRHKGVKVIVGGPHVSIFPEEALQHADAVVVGEAEEVWGQLLQDFQQGCLQKIYKASGLFDLKNFPSPRLEMMPKEFIFKNSTLASKGCPFRCNFCFTNSINQYQQRFRPIADVVQDIEAMDGNWLNRKYFVFWDDNLVGDPRYAKELFKAIAPLNRKWAAAASVNIANDEEMLQLLEKSGCAALFIGMESINSASLKESNKYHNHTEKYREMIKKLHDHGIGITGAFVFGFDHDDLSVFERTLEFAIKIELDCMTPAILTPLPGTPLYLQMDREKRIFDRNWSHYDYYHVIFEPKQMKPEKLYEGFLKFNHDFFSYHSILKRISHSRNQLILATLANLGYQSFYKRMFREYELGVRGIEKVNAQEAKNKESIKVQNYHLPILSNSDIPSPSKYYNTKPSLNNVQVLVDTDEIFPYVFNMISNAQKSIRMEMYLLEGKIGKYVIDLLLQKAENGVEVQLIYQPPANLDIYKKIMKFLNRLGLKNRAINYITFNETLSADNHIQVAPFPLHLFRRKVALKMAHNKILIVDGKEAMIGGMNFASITERNHDVMVVARGAIVHEMEKVFQYNWQLSNGAHRISYLPDQKEMDAQTDQSDIAWVSYLVTLPYLENTKAFLLKQIKNARKRILIEMYLFTDPELTSAIIAAAKRGLEVRVLLDANRLPLEFDLHGFPNKKTIHKLIKANIPVRIYRCEPGQEMHTKVALFDEDKVIVGSTNWTRGSFTANSESSFFIKSKVIHKKFKQIFEKDWNEKSDIPQPLSIAEKNLAAGMRLIDNLY